MKIGLNRKRPFRSAVFIGVLAGSVFSSSGAFAGEIATQEDLAAVISGTNYSLSRNIEVSTSWTPLDYSNGTFNGNGFTIIGLNLPLFNMLGSTLPNVSTIVENLNIGSSSNPIVISDPNPQGLLANFSQGTSLGIGKTTQIINVDVNGTINNTAGINDVGGLVGRAANVEILNSSATGTINSSNWATGGLIGYAEDSIVFDSSSNVSLNGTDYVGGLIGHSHGTTISNSFATGIVTGTGIEVGGLVGRNEKQNTTEATITNSFASGQVTGVDSVGGLVGKNIESEISTSYASGQVTGTSFIGGLVGWTNGSISNTYAIGNVNGENEIGGLVGKLSNSDISNSFALGNINANTYIGGGIVGSSYNSIISNVISTGNITGLTTTSQIGGIAGYAEYSTINDVAYEGDLFGFQYVGGLVGNVGFSTEISRGKAVTNITSNSYAGGVTGNAESGFRLNNTEVTANIQGNEVIGGLVGYARGTSAASDIQINNSYWKGNLTATLGPNYKASAIAYAQRTDDSTSPSYYINYTVEDPLYNWFAARIDGNNVVGRVNAPEWFGSVDIPNPTSMLQDFATQRVTGNTWAICSSINQSNPYLISLYPNNPCQNTNVRRSGVERESREQVKLKPSSAIEKSLGFKNDRLFPNSAFVSFVGPREEIDIDKVKSVEIASTANVRVSAKSGEALQISLKSGSKEPVELWVKSPDGTWLLAGVITFDKNGKAVLPPLQFKSAGDFTLALSKPTADSAKGSAPMNQTGSLLVEVI